MGALPAGDADLPAYAKWLIKFKARQLIGKYGIRPSDEEDLRQQLAIHLLQQLGRHDPGRGKQDTFIAQIIDSAVAMILRYRGQQKRAGASTLQSLDVEIGHDDGHPTTVGRVVTDADHARRLQQSVHSEQHDRDRKLDIDAVIACLPPDLHDICIHLMEKPEATVAKEMGVSRHWMREASERIRKHFEAAGLGNS